MVVCIEQLEVIGFEAVAVSHHHVAVSDAFVIPRLPDISLRIEIHACEKSPGSSPVHMPVGSLRKRAAYVLQFGFKEREHLGARICFRDI